MLMLHLRLQFLIFTVKRSYDSTYNSFCSERKLTLKKSNCPLKLWEGVTQPVERLTAEKDQLSRISSVGRALACKAGGRGFDSRDRTNTQGLKITRK